MQYSGQIEPFLTEIESASHGIYHPSQIKFSGGKQSGPIKPDKLLDLSLEMLCVIGLDGSLKYLTPIWQKCLGWSRRRLQSKPLQEWIHSEDGDSTQKELSKLIYKESETIVFKNRLLCKNGNFKWLRWKVKFCPKDKLFYGSAQDLGEQPQCSVGLSTLSSSFNSTESQFRLLVEGVKNYAIYMLDCHGRVLNWNQGAERINGWTAQEIVGESFDRFFPVEAVNRGTPAKLLEFAEVAGRVEYENWRLRRDGSCFWAQVAIAALKDENGQLLGFAIVTRDTTERKQVEEALQEAYEDLEKRVEERTAELTKANTQLQAEVNIRKQTEEALRQSKSHLKTQASQLEEALQELKNTQAQLIHTEKMSSLGQLVSGIAHEINNPIGFIHSNLSYLNEYTRDLCKLLEIYQKHESNSVLEIQETIDEIDLDFIKADLPKIISSMKVGTQRITEIVQSLRNFSRHDEAQLKSVNLHDGIDSTLLILAPQFKGNRKPYEIELVKKYGNLPLVECYASQLNQVFINLLQNAIDALSIWHRDFEKFPPPRIEIRTEVKEKMVAIHIADNGIGMTAEVCQRIFDPFFTTKPVGKGTGLGLSTSYEIVVNQHRGQLNCQSYPGKGTQLTIEIPIEQAVN